MLAAPASVAKKKARFRQLREALIRGYALEKGWDSEDEKILPYLVMARKLAMLGWLQSRSDNPRIAKYLRTAVKKTVKRLKVDFEVT